MCLVGLAGAVFLFRSHSLNSAAALARPPVTVIAGFDTSGSNRGTLNAQTGAAAGFLRQLDSDRDRLVAYRVDRSCEEFYDSRLPEGLESLMGILLSGVEREAARPGTRPASFWNVCLERISRSREAVAVLLLTDGQVDDQSPAARAAIKRAADRLARNKRVKRVAIWGVTPPNRELIRRLMGVLGDRLELRGPEDMTASELLQALQP